jgi:GntR family transcriptional regulator
MLTMDLKYLEGVPLYVKIREVIREDISNGTLKRGDKLPSEDELASRYGVSRMTVRQGITDLIDEGHLYRRHGIGTFVAHLHLERDHSKLTNFYEVSKMDGVEINEQVLKIEVLPARRKVAKALDLNEGDLIIFIKTIRFTDNVPITIHEAYIPHKLFSPLLKDDLLNRPQYLWDLYEKCGHKVKRAVQKLEARLADGKIAGILKVDEGSPILYKERTIFADDGTPIEFLYCYNRGDMYSLTVTLLR